MLHSFPYEEEESKFDLWESPVLYDVIMILSMTL